jgi:hypothetical protein
MLEYVLVPVDDRRQLFISPVIDDWANAAVHGVDIVIDLEGGLDHCIPTVPDTCLYIYFPILDEGLPNLSKLRGIAKLGASLIGEGHVVLSHCGMGFNRSALVAGLILVELGMPGREAVARLRERRPGALFNETFADYLESLGS